MVANHPEILNRRFIMQTSRTNIVKGAFFGRLGRIIAAAALAAGSVPLMQFAQPAQAAGNITGTVFQDFNGNGVRDTAGALGTAVDDGIASVTVSAYDASGALQGTTNSTPSGAYTLTATGTGPYRIEFTNLPTGYQPSARGSGTGANATSVQFVADGASSNVNFAINKPAEYCQNNPTLCTGSFVFGDQVSGANNAASVLVSFPYNGSGSPYSADRSPNPGNLATAQQVGSTFGLAYQRSSKTLFTSSFYKVYAGFGPGGPGAIYRVPTTGGSPSVLATVPNAGTNSHTGGTVNTGPGNNNPGTWLNDYQNWDSVGKSSLGGLALSEDGSTLYVVNLNDRRLYSVDVNAATPTAADRGAIPSPCANAADARPFGLGFKEGLLYVGGVCSAQSTNNTANLSAYIYTYNGISFSASPAFSFSMAPGSYPHGAAGNFCGPTQPNGNWNPWTATNQFTNGTSGTFCAYPQPILSDITFDGTDMLIGIRDRFGDQAGQDVPGAAGVGANPGQGEGVSAGDIIRACGTTGTSWTLEANGACGGVNGAGVGDGQGPGGGEFYQDTFSSSTNNNINHNEVSSGGVVQVPGFNNVAYTAMNPATSAGNGGDWRAGGVRTNSSTSGTAINFYEVYDKCDSSGQNRLFSNCATESGRFGKVSGMGDVIALCDEAPIEIGNRIWTDANGNGIQDPGELPLGSVIVSLQTPTGTLTTQTDGSGNYYFSNLRPNTAYTISVAPGQGALNGGLLTQANANGQTNNNAITDMRDSDAALVGGTPTIYYTTGTAGQNNHSLDIGFNQNQLVNLGDRVWFDTNNDGVIGGSEPGVDAVAVQLYQDTNGDGVFSAGDTFIRSTSTGGGGFYNFTNLTPTSSSGTGYLVVLPASNFQSGGPLFNYQNSTSTVAGNSDLNDRDHGNVIGAMGPSGSGVVASSVVSLTVGGEPPAGVDGTDTNGNQTIDFGFYQLTLGNQVWVDTNNDGLLNNGELGLSGVTVQLLDSGNNVIGNTQTDANGIYTFTNLTPGTYSVQIVMPNGFGSSTGPGQEANPDLNGEDNDNGALITGQVARSNPIVLTVGGEPTVDNATGRTTNSTLDFGIVQLASLGNYVWVDSNHDGIQNDGNTGLGGVTVVLYDVNGNPISTTVTDGTGFYQFVDLVPGTYSVGFTAPTGYTFTIQGGDPASDADSNANPSTGRTAPVTLAPGQNNPTLDAGVWVPAPAISLKKYTNGFDADVLPGPYLPIGSQVTWRFDVQNTGNVTLTNVTLTDDKVGAITCPQSTLAPNEVMSCTATGVTTAGQYANTGTVTGTNQINPGQTVVGVDPSHYFGSNAGLTIKKFTNGFDADTIPGPFVTAGGTVTWTYIVSNTGNTALVNVSVSDDVIGAVTCPQNTLAIGESMTCTMTGIAISGQYTNTGTVVGTDPNNPNTPLSTNDPSHYYGSNAGLVLKKFVNGDDAQTAPGISVTVGSAVVFRYVMTNTGNVALVNVALTDDKIGPITCPKNSLAVGESMVCTANGTAVAGQYTNIGTVTGNDVTNPTGPALTSSDPANYFGSGLLASLGNYVWVDANRDGQQGNPSVEPPLAGVTVTLYNSSGTAIATTTTNASGFYSFTNLVPGTYSVGFMLPPNYAFTQQGSTPTSDTDSNVNPATGRTDPVTLVGGENNPTIDAGVFVQAPAISLKKFVNGNDAQTPPGVFVQVGSTVTWTYVVKNIGNVALVNVAVNDDREGAIACPKSTLAVNEEMTCTKTGVARQGQYTNVGTVTARDASNPTGPALTSADPANYFGTATQIIIRKRSIPVDVVNGQQTEVNVGDRITYTIQVTNTGNVTATNVRVSDGIPAGTQFVAGSAVPAQASGPNPLVWVIGNLGPGATASVSFAVTVINRDPVAVQNTAGVVSNETVTATASNTIVHTFKTTAVELIDFSAAGGRVQWTTGAELNTFGFTLYRSNTSNRSDATLVSAEMISARGSNSRYEFVDATAQAGVAYHYWLVEVETTGNTREYGPVKTDVRANGTEVVSQLPIANSVLAGGVVVQTDGTPAHAAAVVANVQSSALSAPTAASQGVSTVNAEAVRVNASQQAAPQVAVVNEPQPAVTTSDSAIASVMAVAPSNAVQAAPSETNSITTIASEAAASPDSDTTMPVVTEAKPVVQKAVVVVAQPKATTHKAATTPRNTAADKLMQAVMLASVLAGVVVLVGSLGLGAVVLARRKRK
jgi:uncharacterized repeat protein (TIGR01451 family)